MRIKYPQSLDSLRGRTSRVQQSRGQKSSQQEKQILSSDLNCNYFPNPIFLSQNFIIADRRISLGFFLG